MHGSRNLSLLDHVQHMSLKKGSKFTLCNLILKKKIKLITNSHYFSGCFPSFFFKLTVFLYEVSKIKATASTTSFQHLIHYKAETDENIPNEIRMK